MLTRAQGAEAKARARAKARKVKGAVEEEEAAAAVGRRHLLRIRHREERTSPGVRGGRRRWGGRVGALGLVCWRYLHTLRLWDNSGTSKWTDGSRGFVVLFVCCPVLFVLFASVCRFVVGFVCVVVGWLSAVCLSLVCFWFVVVVCLAVVSLLFLCSVS